MKKHLANGKMNTIGINPLSKRVYMGTDKPVKGNPDHRVWEGDKVDVTEEYKSILPEFIPEINESEDAYEGFFFSDIQTKKMELAVVKVDVTKENSLKTAIKFFEKQLKNLEKEKLNEMDN